MGAVEKLNGKLPDGRQIRVLKGTFTQKQMFTLHKSGLVVPANETVMSVKEHDQSIKFGAFSSISAIRRWRTREYAFYRRGFEEGLPLGERIVYVEDCVAPILNIPDVEVKLPKGGIIGLRQAKGMGIIKLEKLELKQIDRTKEEISVTTDFDPATDVKVVDVMPKGWALVDADCIPLRSKPSDHEVKEARFSHVKRSYEFREGSTGYHGSIARDADDLWINKKRIVYVSTPWCSDMEVALVSRFAAAPRDEEILKPLGEGAYTESPPFVTVRVSTSVIEAAEEGYAAHVHPEELVAFRQLLDSLAIKE